MVALFALLANATRLRLLLSLYPAPHESPEMCVCDLAAITEASQSMTSHQLRLLRESGLVESRRAGKMVLYRLADGPQGHMLFDALEHGRTRP
jgi:DNA-binding transcriptional ArsR family regulator